MATKLKTAKKTTRRMAVVWMTNNRDAEHGDVSFWLVKPINKGDYFVSGGDMFDVAHICREKFLKLFGFLPKPDSCQRVTIHLEHGGKQ